jgi:hypothetical protein
VTIAMRAAILAVICAASVSTASLGAGKPELRVIGAVRTPNGGVAICRELTTGQVFSLKTGDSFRGWRLSALTIDRVTFERDSEKAVLEITETANSAVSPPTRAPAVSLAPQPPILSPAPQAPTTSPIPQLTVDAPGAPAGAGAMPSVPMGKWVDGDGQVIDAPRTR